LSERAVRVLMERCGWDAPNQRFAAGFPGRYELYAQFGLALGRYPTASDAEIGKLSCAVVPLPDAQFYHFGTNAQMIESISALQNLVVDGSKLGLAGARRQPDQVNQNSRFDAPLRREGDQAFWIENSAVPAGWQLATEHVLTGVPENDWSLRLEPSVCLDFVPVDEKDFCIRAYGFSDSFSGKLSDPSPVWNRRWISKMRNCFPWCRKPGWIPLLLPGCLLPILSLGTISGGSFAICRASRHINCHSA
jgi:hypothetical protein